jgi:putative nucleotidyltransferase with HDIG domain
MSKNLVIFEYDQRRNTLAIITWTAMIVAVALGLFDIQFGTWLSVIALFGLALFCIPILLLNSSGHSNASAVLLSLFVLSVISLNLYDGDGVHDPDILAYPIFIMVGTLVFGKRASPFFAFAAIGSLTLIVYLEFFKYIHPRIGPTTFGILVPMIALLLAASAIISVIVDNIEKNLDRARKSEAELRMNYDLTLEAWAKVMEYRDRETEGHSRRLGELCTRLARELGESEEDIVQLQRGALLHDIGKLAIPDEILLKPAALDQDEKRIIQKHPVFAKQMLSGIPFLQPSICIAYSHHERWDGQGYPDGLKGEEIPKLARIFSVVDTWDALRSKRVYRPALPVEEAAAYLKENAGIIYDPDVVEVFLGMI